MSEVFDWIRARIDSVRDSLFLLPAGLIIALAAASQFARDLDGALGPGDNPWLLATTTESARAILTTVATATVTVAAIVFSMTSVVVQLATSQFSPRVTQDFLRDRYQQVTIGITIGTFVYALLVLGSVREAQGDTDRDYHFSVTVGVVLAVFSMLAIVSFIDRVMRSMRIDTIVHSLAQESEAAFLRLPKSTIHDDQAAIPTAIADSTGVELTQPGWVRSIDIEEILSALPGNTSVRLDVRTGDFNAKHVEVGTVWPAVDEKTADAVAKAIQLGRTRTVQDDPAYGIRQMVDIALRALSPSINDPTTAADVVRQLTGPLKALLLGDAPERVVGDERGNRVYVPRSFTFSDYVHGAFTEIRLNAGGQPYALLALVETLGSLLGMVDAADIHGRSTALLREAAATIETIRSSDMSGHEKTTLYEAARAAGIEVPEHRR
ncbi:MAG TPA: DUF2254 domain-containing protein [Acidimicrobiia bacterium]|nr:DUF2254 domain-containing protein [Acidimicrobiia bacterium]